MGDRDDLAELVGSARTVIKCPAFHFNGRIRYEKKGEKLEERLLCMDAFRVYICSVKIPVKIEFQFNILTIKLVDRITDSHVLIEADEKQVHAFHGLQERSSLQPFLVVLIRNLHAVFPHKLSSIMEIRPENEYEKLLRLSNEYTDEKGVPPSVSRPCGGFSLRYECACDLYQTPYFRAVPNLIDTIFAYRLSREFTFREMDSLSQKDWLPILSALRHNEWFKKLTIENTKLSTENIEEIVNVSRQCRALQELRLVNCNLRQEFCNKFAHSLAVTHIENLDLSNNAIEDKGLSALGSSLAARKSPLRSLNLQSCSISHKSLYQFHTALTTNPSILKNLTMLNLAGNRIKEENCLTLLFANQDNALEELHLSDIEFSLESFFHNLATLACKLRRLFITSIKPSSPSSITGGVKLFFSRNATLEVLQLSNLNLSVDFLRELCDGLLANTRLNKLDLRLPGNPLEVFIRDNAARLASIPSLVALDITGCDVDNEIPTLLNELKKNRKLKSLQLGRNFTNVKAKNVPRTIHAMKELIWENELESFSIADSKLKENLGDFLTSVTNNTSLHTLDIRGNAMGDTSVRVLTRILRINRHLRTIYFDRNFLSLNNFEDIVDAMEENLVIQYLPVPITDIVLMKTTEKERMEKLQQLLSKLDSICSRNQHSFETISATDSLTLIPAANLNREISLSSENQQQLIGDQATLDYVSSCTNRSSVKSEELSAILTRSTRIPKLASQLTEICLAEEENLQEQWKQLCEGFKVKLREKDERIAKKCSQVLKEQTQLSSSDEKLQEQIRSFFTQSTESIHQLLNKEIPGRLTLHSRQCSINLLTHLQKRAYDTNNDLALDMHKQLESAMFTTNADDQSQSSSSTIDRLVTKGTNVLNRIAHRHAHTPSEPAEDLVTNRAVKKDDSTEYVAERSPKAMRAPVKENPRLLTASQSKAPAPTSPKPPAPAGSAGWRRSVLASGNEQDAFTTPTDTEYSHAYMTPAFKKNGTPVEDEGDLIAGDLLDLVKQEEEKDQQHHHQYRAAPPAIPPKKRAASGAQEGNLDIEVETTTKLVHPSKDRPRRANVTRPVRRPTNGGSHDSSSDGGLDNDEPAADLPPSPPPTAVGAMNYETSGAMGSADLQTSEAAAKAVGKVLKSPLKVPKSPGDEFTGPPPVPAKHQPPLPTLQPRPSAATLMSKSISTHNSEPASQLTNSDVPHQPLQGKPSLPASNYGGFSLSNKDENNPSTETTSSPMAPAVAARPGKAALGTRVLPALDSNGEQPPVRLRHLPPAEKKPDLLSATDPNYTPGDPSAGLSPDSEQYKRMSVKERARMLTTHTPATGANDKKTGAAPTNSAGV